MREHRLGKICGHEQRILNIPCAPTRSNSWDRRFPSTVGLSTKRSGGDRGDRLTQSPNDRHHMKRRSAWLADGPMRCARSPKNISLWAVRSVNLAHNGISYLQTTGKQGFWATINVGLKWLSSADFPEARFG